MIRALLFFLFSFLFITASSYAQGQNVSRVQTTKYLHSADFNTVNGIIKVNFPSDMATSELTSGSITFSRYKLGNIGSGSLRDYSIIIENQIIEITGNNFKVQVPANLPTGVLNFIIRDKAGKDVGRAFFPVRIGSTSNLLPGKGNPSDFRMPVSARTNLPTQIVGPFDGNYLNTQVSVDGVKIHIVAESPRKVIFYSPPGVKGSRVLALNERGILVKSPFTNLYVVKVGRDEVSNLNTPNNSTEYLIEKDGLAEGEKLIEQKPQESKNLEKKSNYAPNINRKSEIGPSIEEISEPLKLNPNDIKVASKKNKPLISNQNNTEELIAEKQFNNIENKRETIALSKNDLEHDNNEVNINKTAIKNDKPKNTSIDSYMDKQFDSAITKYKDDKPKKVLTPQSKPKVVKKKKPESQPKINDLESLNIDGDKAVKQSIKTDNKKKIETKQVAKINTKINTSEKPLYGSKTFAIQLASFKNRYEAEKLVNKLNSRGYKAYFEKTHISGKGYWNRVKIGGFKTRTEAEKYKKTLNFDDLFIKSFFITLENK